MANADVTLERLDDQIGWYDPEEQTQPALVQGSSRSSSSPP
jgi:hypothetical protein